MKQLSQGGRANRTGQTAEAVIAAILARHAYRVEAQKRIGLGIFETDVIVDFHISGHPQYSGGLIIESKWQAIGGSVDEKWPFLVLNIKECYPCPTIIVIHGGGFRPGAERWLRRQVGGKLIFVFRLEEFLSWCNHNL